MSQRLACIALLVPDYDEAIAWYRDALGFRLVEDVAMAPGKRWVRLVPRGAGDDDAGFLLARAATPAQQQRIGDQAGGRVFLFLHTDAFDADLERLVAHGGQPCESPREEAYGRVVVFADRYGNRWDLIQPRAD